MEKKENSKNGIWQLAEEIPINQEPDNTGLFDIDSFIFKDDTLILKLPSVSTTMHKAPDDVYRLVTKWKNNILFFFPPFGIKWEMFASWEDEQFLMYGANKTRVYKKIKPEEIAPQNKQLLKPCREIWEYDRELPEAIL